MNETRDIPVATRLQDPELERSSRSTLPGLSGRKTPCRAKLILSIDRRASRLLDIDNLSGGCKPLIDALRYSRLIPDDDPESVKIEITQTKVAPGEAQGTIVIIKPIQ